MADLFIIPFFIATFISPIRGSHALYMIVFGGKAHKYRENVHTFFFLALSDVLALALFPLYCLHPMGLQYCLWPILKSEAYNEFTYAKYVLQFDGEVNADYGVAETIIHTAGYTVISFVGLLFAVPLVLLTPSTWRAAWLGYEFYYTKKTSYVAGANTNLSVQKETLWEYFDEEIELTHNLIGHAIIDIWVAPFALLAYISPLRHSAISTLSARLEAERPSGTSNVTRNLNPNHDPNLDPNQPSGTSNVAPHEWEFEYNPRYREKVVKYGSLAIAGMYVCNH